MLIKLKQLNTKNKEKKQSFHADQPRKNRGKGMSQAVELLKPVKRQAGTNIKTKTSDSHQRSGASSTPSTSAAHSHQSERESSSKSQQVVVDDHVCNDNDKAKSPAALGGGSEDCDSSGGEASVFPLRKVFDGADGGYPTDSELGDSPASSPKPEQLSASEHQAVSQVKRKLAAQGKESDISVLKKLRSNQSCSKDGGLSRGKCQSPPPPRPNVKGDLAVGKCQTFSGTAKSDLREGSSQPPATPRAIPKVRASVFGQDLHESHEEPNDAELYEDSDDETVLKKKSDSQKPGDTSKKAKKPDKGGKKKGAAGEHDDLGRPAEDTDDDVEAVQVESQLQLQRFTKDDVALDPKKYVQIRGRSKELADKSFYVANKALLDAKLAVNATTFSKQLLVAAFSDKALLECSLSGGEFRAGGRENFRRKPALDQDVVAVIIDVTLKRQSLKEWKPAATKREILSGLRQKLVDVRPRLKKLLEEGANKQAKDSIEA